MIRRISAVSLAASLLLLTGCENGGAVAPSAPTAPSIDSAKKASEAAPVERKGARGKTQGTNTPAVPD